MTADMKITINLKTIPTFAQIPPICEGENVVLPTKSDNGISGNWSLAIDDTQTKTYTFTPNTEECATTAEMKITVNPKTVPVFAQIAPICEGENVELPIKSDNGISGNWSLAAEGTGTKTYTFTPDEGECATTAKQFRHSTCLLCSARTKSLRTFRQAR